MVGHQVFVWWEGDRKWYPGIVTSFKKVGVQVLYDDNEILWESTEKKIRMQDMNVYNRGPIKVNSWELYAKNCTPRSSANTVDYRKYVLSIVRSFYHSGQKKRPGGQVEHQNKRRRSDNWRGSVNEYRMKAWIQENMGKQVTILDGRRGTFLETGGGGFLKVLLNGDQETTNFRSSMLVLPAYLFERTLEPPAQKPSNQSSRQKDGKRARSPPARKLSGRGGGAAHGYKSEARGGGISGGGTDTRYEMTKVAGANLEAAPQEPPGSTNNSKSCRHCGESFRYPSWLARHYTRCLEKPSTHEEPDESIGNDSGISSSSDDSRESRIQQLLGGDSGSASDSEGEGPYRPGRLPSTASAPRPGLQRPARR
jgi:hypothetical protein